MTVLASKSDLAYEWVRERIARQEYGPGYRLVLAPIAATLGMSVVPVREAIRRLEAEGLVTFERNIGARVAVVDEEEYINAMQTLGFVEGAATALASSLLTAADLDRAEAINESMRTLLARFDPYTFTRLNQEFHTVLFTACPNPDLLDLVHRGWARLSGLRDSTFAFVPERAEVSVEEHAQLLDLIRSGRPALDIELDARNHRWRTLDAFLHTRHPDRYP